MSTEFNFRRAHRELAQPAFAALPEGLRNLYSLVAKHSSRLQQNKNLTIEFPDDEVGAELRAAFSAFSDRELLDAAEVIHRWGHWAHECGATIRCNGMPDEYIVFDDWDSCPRSRVRDRLKQLEAYAIDDIAPTVQYHRAGPNNSADGCAYWKVQLLAESLVRERKGQFHKTKLDTSSFMDHKPGTEYTLEELPQFFAPKLSGAFDVVDCRDINHRVEDSRGNVISRHPFCIGVKHFRKDSIYLDPRSAPCHICNMDYDSHKHDRVLVVRAARDMTENEASEILKSIASEGEAHKLDGIAFAESEFKIS